jgi:hypothetical protein
MSRKILNGCAAKVHTVIDPSSPEDYARKIEVMQEDMGVWMEAQAKEHSLSTLLAHADDGVIWGKINDKGNLLTSDTIAPGVSPPFRVNTLQQAAAIF